MQPDLPLSDKQALSVRESTARINLWEGSIRSGKTIASLLRWLLYINSSKVRGELIVVSRTRGSAARNVFAPLMDPTIFGRLASQTHYTAGADSGWILGRKVWVLGSSDVRSENVLRGLTCAGAYVDEVTLLREDFFTQLLNRLWEGARLFGTTNPDNPAHWLKRKFLDRIVELPDWATWHFLLDDNPKLSEERKEAIRRENTGLFYQRNVLGKWVAAEGQIFDMWNPDLHVVPAALIPPMDRVHAVGVDYGTQNATSAVMLGQAVDGRLYFVDEWRHDPQQSQARLTDAQQSQQFRAWLAGPHLVQGVDLPPRFVCVDPAAASFKVQLHNDGVRGVQNADPNVAYGIRIMASLVASGDLLVSDKCAGVINEMPGYSWDPKAALKGEDKPIKVADHSLDAARYAVTTTEALWLRRLPNRTLIAAA